MNLNTPTPPPSGTMDVDEFMAFLETRPDEEHWELIEGVAVMMAPPSYAHQRIAHNLSNLLNTAFMGRRIDAFPYINSGIRNPGLRNFQPLPDIVVVPGVAGYDLYAEHYLLAAEVLSPSNTRKEIDLKLRRYCEAPENLYAIVIEPREFHVEIYAKRNKWDAQILRAADDLIEMPEFGLTCHVVDLYRGTPLDPEIAKS